jgi:hypothetical protein
MNACHWPSLVDWEQLSDGPALVERRYEALQRWTSPSALRLPKAASPLPTNHRRFAPIFAVQPMVAPPPKRTLWRRAGTAAMGRFEPMSQASTSGRSMARNGQTGFAIVALRNGIALRRRGGMPRSAVQRPRPTRNDATGGPSRHPCARVRHGTRASTAGERVERRAAGRSFVAPVETPNREIDLIGRTPAPPAERDSKTFCKMSLMVRESCTRL